MYKIHNNLAPSYLNEMFLMQDANLDNTTSNLRSVTNKNFVVPLAKCNDVTSDVAYHCVTSKRRQLKQLLLHRRFYHSSASDATLVVR